VVRVEPQAAAAGAVLAATTTSEAPLAGRHWRGATQGGSKAEKIEQVHGEFRRNDIPLS